MGPDGLAGVDVGLKLSHEADSVVILDPVVLLRDQEVIVHILLPIIAGLEEGRQVDLVRPGALNESLDDQHLGEADDQAVPIGHSKRSEREVIFVVVPEGVIIVLVKDYANGPTISENIPPFAPVGRVDVLDH